MYPLLASEVVAGFPITNLSGLTPFAAIWKRALSGQVGVEVVSRPEHVVYSEAPSVTKRNCDEHFRAWKEFTQSLTIVKLDVVIFGQKETF